MNSKRVTMKSFDELIQGLSPEKCKLLALRNPLSFSQQRIWFIDRMQPGNAGYNIPYAVRLRGRLDTAALKDALAAVCQRHQVLRACFGLIAGRPVQLTNPTFSMPFTVTDLTGLSQPASPAADLAADEAARPFDLSRGPLFRVVLLRLSADEHHVLLNMHHTVSDGWSMDILIREIGLFYNARAMSGALPPSKPAIQYTDYARWQRGWLKGDELEEQLAYWRQKLADAPARLELPTDRPRPGVQTFDGSQTFITLPGDIGETFRSMCRGENTTLFMGVLSLLGILTARYSRQDDVVIGTPVANRNRPETVDLIGCFINTLPLRLDLTGNPRYQAYLQAVRTTVVEGFRFQEPPFEKLVEVLKPARDLSVHPLFQTVLIVESPPDVTEGMKGLSLEALVNPVETTKFDLTFRVLDTTPDWYVGAEYNTNLFDEQTIKTMLTHLANLIEWAPNHMSRKVAELDLLSEQERTRLLVDWNRQHEFTAPVLCAHQLFEDQVRRTPDVDALDTPERVWRYNELNLTINRLAHHLRRMGVVPEKRVGVYMNKSTQAVVAMFAIMKAGGVYLPLDPAQPKDRLDYMLSDSGVELLLCESDMMGGRPPGVTQILELDEHLTACAQENGENPEMATGLDHLAYTIYTSGSTGRPKGALIRHRGIGAVILGACFTATAGVGTRIVRFASPGFDASIIEVFCAMFTGATLCIPPLESQTPGFELADYMRTKAINWAIFTPSTLEILTGEMLPDLKTVIAGGEACTPELVRNWSTGRRFFNAYGPTECTIAGSIGECHDKGLPPDIGRHIPNVQLYILDPCMNPCPRGVAGEIHLGGPGLGRGYHMRPDLTAAVFTPHPFGVTTGGRLYKTGDLARFTPEGKVLYVGRIDHQVKLRGFRIEIGEIEHVLTEHPAIRQAVVLVEDSPAGGKRLVAHLLSPHSNEALQTDQLRAFLAEKLPAYMIPTAFIPSESFPLNPSGKPDRAALSRRAGQLEDESSPFTAPETQTQEKVAAIWSDILKQEKVGIHDNFYDLGGHSLLAVKVQQRLIGAFERELPMVKLFELPTVAALAAFLDQEETGQTTTVDAEQGRDWAQKRRQALMRQRQRSTRNR